MDGRIEPLGSEKLRPDVPGLLIERSGIGRLRCIDTGVKAIRRKTPGFDHQIPGPQNGFLFEIIAKRPVAQHLKHRVVIGVITDILEVIVFAASTNAFLRVSGTWWIVRSLVGSEEIRHKLVHARIRKEQTW